MKRSATTKSVLRRARGLWRAAASVGLALLAAALGSAPAAAELVFEAELCRELTFPWRPVRAEGAAAGLALSVPEGAGSSEAFSLGREGRARFDLPAEAGGERELWVRVYWNGNCSNSLFVSCPPEWRLLTVDSYRMRTWHWLKVPDLRLPPDATSVDLVNREDGVWVDQICVRPPDQPAPVGVLSALTAWPAPGPALPAVSVVPAPGGPGIEALPPTEYLLHHTREARLSLPRQPVLVVFPGQETPLEIWLRRNRLAGLPGMLRLEPPEHVIVEPATTVALPAMAPPLECLPFAVRAHPNLPRGFTQLICRVQTADGLEQVRAIRVLRPYRWLLSQPLRFNPAAGLDQLAVTDAAVLAAPLGSAHGVVWHDAEPRHFTPFGLLDLRRAVSAEPFVQAYAFTRCRAAGGPATLDLTHDDWIRVWVNGACVYSNAESAPSTLTRTRVPVTFRAGDNDVLVRCAQFKNYWEFGLVAEPVDESISSVPALAAAAQPVAAAAPPAPEPLPPWSFEGIVQDLPALFSACPPGQGWTVFAAACRECPLTPVETWRRLSSAVQGLARGAAERRHCAEALLGLRRRVDQAVLTAADRAALRALTFRDRVAFLRAGAPIEAGEESLAAAVWTDSAAERQELQVEAIRLLLCGDAADAATAYLAGPAAADADLDSLRGLVALYEGDRSAAEAGFTEVSSELAGRYADWLLGLGRAAEAEWLLRRVAAPSAWNRLSLAKACVDQRRFAEGEALLLECLRRDDSPRAAWEKAASELAAFHAARCSLPQASAQLRAAADALSPHRLASRGRLLQALWHLDLEAHEPVAALRDALAAADLSAGSYRMPSRATFGTLLQPAFSQLLEQARYSEVIDLCNQVIAVAPGLHLQVDAYRLGALQELGRSAAAEAVLARLLPAVVADSAQARRVLSLLRVSGPAADAAERLAQAVLDGQTDEPLLSPDAASARAYATAVLGQYGETAGALEQALSLSLAAGRSPEATAAQGRFWTAQCLGLAHGDPLLIAALLTCPADPVRQAATAAMPQRGSSLPTDLLAQAHDLDAQHSAADPDSAADGDPPETAADDGPQVMPLLMEMLAAGVIDQIAMDAEDTPTVWIVEHGRFPFCVELGAGDTLTRFDSALRAFGTPLPVGRKVVFLHGQVWIGTDRGLFCYHPEADSWDRLRLPGSRPDAAVSALTVEDGQLRVTWATAAGRQMQGSFSLESGVWETTVPP